MVKIKISYKNRIHPGG